MSHIELFLWSPSGENSAKNEILSSSGMLSSPRQISFKKKMETRFPTLFIECLNVHPKQS
jgi:hypothetical protein